MFIGFIWLYYRSYENFESRKFIFWVCKEKDWYFWSFGWRFVFIKLKIPRHDAWNINNTSYESFDLENAH
jgi:hypothetical protein